MPESQLHVKPPNYEHIRNVPTEWIRKHGPTKDCNVCKRPTFHGRQHSRACIARYVKWLQGEDAKIEVPHGPSTSYPSSGDVPIPIHADSSQTASSAPTRLYAKQPRPMSLPEPTVPVSLRYGDSLEVDVLKSKGGEGGPHKANDVEVMSDISYHPTTPRENLSA